MSGEYLAKGGRFQDGLRVAYLTRGLPHYRLPVLRELASRGVDCHVATCGLLGAGFIESRSGADEPFTTAHLSGRSRGWRGDVHEWLKAVRPAVIILEHGASLDFTWTVLLSRDLRRIPRVLWTHGIERRELHSGRKGIASAARWLQVRLASGVICYEDTLADQLRRALPGKIVGVAPNTTGGNASFASRGWPGGPDRAAMKRRLGLDRDFYIVAIGRLVPEKEFHRLPNMVAQVRDAGVDAGLIIVGDGPSRSDIEKRSTECNLVHPGDLIFTGAIGDPETLATWLGLSDLHVQPGAVGLAVVDAAFGGIPTITPAPGPSGPFHGPEWIHIRNGEMGFVVDENTDQAIARAVVEFLGMPADVRRELSERCANYARQNLGIERMVDGMMETIESVLRARTA